MFQILDPKDKDSFPYLAQMHHLRYEVFYKRLNWREGLYVASQMEFDQYDHDNASYLVHINNQNNVDACARLTQTNHPYLLGYGFSDYIENIPVPNSKNIIEISRLAADPATAPRNITGQLMSAMLEYGLSNQISHYVSLSDVRIVPIIKRFGWAADEIGKRKNTSTDTSVALSYNVSTEFHENVKKIVGVGNILDTKPPLSNPDIK